MFSRLCEHEMVCQDVFGLRSLVGTLVFDFERLRSSGKVVLGLYQFERLNQWAFI